MQHLRYPNESNEYRAARNALLDDEIALRAQIENVAAKRRALPIGGEVPENYLFERIGKSQHAGEGENVGAVRPGRHPDPLQLHVRARARVALPGLHAFARRHRRRRKTCRRAAAFHVVAKSPIARLAAWAHERGWNHLSLLSTAGNSYDADYFGDTSTFSAGMRKQHRVPDGENWDETIFNVFRKQTENPPLLGLRDELRSNRAETAPSRRRSRRSLVGFARHDAGRPRRLLPEGCLRPDLRIGSGSLQYTTSGRAATSGTPYSPGFAAAVVSCISNISAAGGSIWSSHRM